MVWGHYQWMSKLLTQIALCKHVYDNRTQIVKPKYLKVTILLSSNATTTRFFFRLIDKVQCDLKITFDPRTWLKNSDNP